MLISSFRAESGLIIKATLNSRQNLIQNQCFQLYHNHDQTQYNIHRMEKVVIDAEFVQIHCFIGVKGLLFETFELIKDGKLEQKENERNVKIVFLVFNMSLKEYTTFYEHLKQTYPDEFKKYFINILMVKSRGQAEDHMNHIRKVNQSQFQHNYLKLQEHSEKSLKTEVLENYIYSKFKWNKVKTKYFLEKNNIASMEELLEYPRFPYFEKSIIDKTKQFKEYCQAAINLTEKRQ